MRSLFVKKDRLSFYFIILLAVAACKKERSVDEQNENLQSVNFKISGFSSDVRSFKSTAIKRQAQANASSTNVSNYVEGYLYFWSFNGETLEPDIAYQTANKPSITYFKGGEEKVPNLVGSTYKFEEYEAGKAISIEGASEILIKVPVLGIEQITQFGFDAGSSNTGPKDFELYYSIDEGHSYKPLALANQFGNTKANNPKNTYVYSLSDKNIIASNLWFKFIPKAGERGEASAFNAVSGAIRFDNIRLVGLSSSSETGGAINKLHYYLFHKDRPEVIIFGAVNYEEASNLKLNLPNGKYSICFISNTSDKDLLLPENPSSSDFYVSNQFSNANAAIFGYFGELDVNGEVVREIRLQRLFSQIKLEFTDVEDLSIIKKIRISQQHEPLFFAPFNKNMSNPVLDQTDIEISADFHLNKQLVFNQFMGQHLSPASLKYDVVLYGAQGPIRTFQLQSTLKQNMQLVFRGNLLESIDQIGTFQIIQELEWDGQEDGSF